MNLEKFKNTTILVTGATGLIGSHIVTKLLAIEGTRVIASGPSIVAMAQDYLKSGKSTKFREMAGDGEITPYIVAKAAEAGDPVAKRIFTIIGEYVGMGLVSVINLLNPEKVIIGGGVAEAGDLLLEPIRKTVMERAMVVARESVEIVPAELGNSAGVIGASMLVE